MSDKTLEAARRAKFTVNTLLNELQQVNRHDSALVSMCILPEIGKAAQIKAGLGILIDALEREN